MPPSPPAYRVLCARCDGGIAAAWVDPGRGIAHNDATATLAAPRPLLKKNRQTLNRDRMVDRTPARVG